MLPKAWFSSTKNALLHFWLKCAWPGVPSITSTSSWFSSRTSSSASWIGIIWSLGGSVFQQMTWWNVMVDVAPFSEKTIYWNVSGFCPVRIFNGSSVPSTKTTHSQQLLDQKRLYAALDWTFWMIFEKWLNRNRIYHQGRFCDYGLALYIIRDTRAYDLL